MLTAVDFDAALAPLRDGAHREASGADKRPAIQTGMGAVVQIRSDGDVVEARRAMREMSTATMLSSTQAAMVATAISEVARNMLAYAGSGEIEVAALHRGARHGVLVRARDEGPGIADVGLALRSGYSTSERLGLGLPGARRLMDEFEIESALGAGTTVTMRKWAT